MSARAYVLEEQTERHNAPARTPAPEALSPELILVLPPAEAQAARQLLPDREPLEEWLLRLREADAPIVEPDWEFESAAPSSRRRLGGALFATACVVNAALPVVLFLIVR
jgi:hypothetical protein